jgi:hypothetical protein
MVAQNVVNALQRKLGPKPITTLPVKPPKRILTPELPYGKKTPRIKPVLPTPILPALPPRNIPNMPRVQTPTAPAPYTVRPTRQFGALGSPSNSQRFSDIVAKRIEGKLQNY